MDRIKKFLKTGSLKQSFMSSVFAMTILVVVFSILSILGCFAVQNWLVPVRDEVMLHMEHEYEYGTQKSALRIRTNGEWMEFPVLLSYDNEGNSSNMTSPFRYSVNPIASPELLTPKRKLLYNTMSICIVVLPMFYAVVGIIVCALQFHKRTLARPLHILMSSAKKIADNDLDFSVNYSKEDEMGMLCSAFEKMRDSLLESQRTTWALMEERKQLNASIAHDIRTPITIIEGYTEYLQRNLNSGKTDEETITRTLSNLYKSTVRLERYVDSVRDIQNLDDMPIYKAEVNLENVIREIQDDMSILCSQTGKILISDSMNITFHSFSKIMLLYLA